MTMGRQVGALTRRRHAPSHPRNPHQHGNRSMIAPRQGGGGYSFRALALALGVLAFCGSPGGAQGGDHLDDDKGKAKMGHPKRPLSPGTLGYGGYGLYPGFSGFGLSFHLGYGYGGYALGVGAEGGYPD